MKTRLFALALATVSFATVHAGQFRSATELVSVYATVKDKESRLVPDLKQEDFVITDNGKEQPISYFSNEITPFSVVVMLDRSGSMQPHLRVIRDAASAFVNRMLPDDKARIGSFGNYTGNRVVISPSAFSSSKGELLEVLQTPFGTSGGWSPVFIAIDQSITALSNLKGRRVVLIFTDGYDSPDKTLVPVKFKDLVSRIRETETMVYALGFVEVITQPDKPPKINLPDKGLRALADDSGGGYFEIQDTANLTDVFTRVAEELHRQYWLGFTPALRDGKTHTIGVTVKQPGMTVQAKKTYVAPSK